MIVDVHTQVWDSPELLGPGMAARIRRAAEGPWELPDASLDAHREAMDPVHYAFVLGSVSKLTKATLTADRVAAAVRANSPKNLGFASIDPLSDGYLQTFDKVQELGLTGVTISPPAQGFHPAHSRAMRLYARCVEAKLPIVFDLGCYVPEAVLEYAQPYLLDGVLREYPDLRVLIGGMGHPFIEQTMVLINKHEHAYSDLAGLTLRPRDLYQALASAYHTGAITKLMMGSGFPMTTPEKAIVTLYSLNTLIAGTNLPSIPREQLRSIVERDALACLGIAYPPGGVTPSQTSRGASGSGGAASKITQTWELGQVKEASQS